MSLSICSLHVSPLVSLLHLSRSVCSLHLSPSVSLLYLSRSVCSLHLSPSICSLHVSPLVSLLHLSRSVCSLHLSPLICGYTCPCQLPTTCNLSLFTFCVLISPCCLGEWSLETLPILYKIKLCTPMIESVYMYYISLVVYTFFFTAYSSTLSALSFPSHTQQRLMFTDTKFNSRDELRRKYSIHTTLVPHVM